MNLQVAHSASEGGSLGQVALAAGVALLGLAFLVQKSLDRRVSVVLVALGLVGLIGSFTFLKNIGGAGTITVQGQEYEEDELVDVVAATCTARDAAEDPDAAQATFLDRVHVPLHVIAVAVEDEDRSLSARLLEAKQDVEEELAEKADPEVLESAFDELIEVTAAALNALDISADTC